MNNIFYVITRVTDRENNEKDKIEGMFYVKFVEVGYNAILYEYKTSKTLRTSTIKDFKIWDNGIIITTKNSVYELEAVVAV